MPSIKSDRWIKKMALEHGMIEPFEDRQVRAGVISYGLSSYGYDIRVADEFKVFTNINSTVVDPKNFDPRSFVDIKADHCIIPPRSFALVLLMLPFLEADPWLQLATIQALGELRSPAAVRRGALSLTDERRQSLRTRLD